MNYRDLKTERPEPGESPKERVDRELNELLQGLRVSATGVQVLFAFLLVLPFQSRFSEMGPLGHRLFFVALLSGALASVCFIAPAAQHRLLFRTSLKEKMLRRANRIGIVGLIFLMVSMATAVALVVETVIDDVAAVIFSGVVALTAAWLWLLQPIIDLHRLRTSRGGRPSR
ncbi:DUF6328 family protein [Streptosporangium lutulentum]|uniref:Amine oxidase n=1 Tax=Streptosporangium lutulentum TaxID=1461250 RepID=A0ABT9QHL8_9ACTN|nr:DUF6328 family protein [Streptosporangium lutulentum]MDP9845871.1 hypothetical protein [Streptosporangium lutulentum]